MDGDWKSEGAIPSLTCRIIQAFGGSKVIQWGGMIRWIIHLQVTLIQYGTIAINLYAKFVAQPRSQRMGCAAQLRMGCAAQLRMRSAVEHSCAGAT